MPRPRMTAPTTRFLARITHDGGTQVCWAEHLGTWEREGLLTAFIRAFVILTPQRKQRVSEYTYGCSGGWLFFSQWEVVVPRTVDRVRQAHLKEMS